MIKILIADDHQMFIDGIKSLLVTENNISITGEAHNGYEVISELEKDCPDIVLMDINMPKMNGLQAAKIILQRFPKVKVLMLTMLDSAQNILSLSKAGVSGYILKNTGKEELLQAIQAIVAGKNFYSQEVMQILLDTKLNNADQYVHLSKRELEVLTLIAQEYNTQEIAEKLFLSRHTVETHRKNLLDKTGAKNIAGLVRYAIEKNLV